MTKRSLLAVASFCSALLFFFPPAWAAALVLGVVALVEIKQSGGAVRGKGLAIAGIVLSVLWGVVLIVLLSPLFRGGQEEFGGTLPGLEDYSLEAPAEFPEDDLTGALTGGTPATDAGTAPATSPATETPAAETPAAQ